MDLSSDPDLLPKKLQVALLEDSIFRGKGELPGQSKPIQTIAQYGSQLKKHLTQGGTNMAKNSETVIRRPRFVRINILQTTQDEVIPVFRKKQYL